MITLQYLEDAPDMSQRQTEAVVNKLRTAAGQLPISHLLIGWHLPKNLRDACRKEAERLGIRFLRWHPLLTGDSVFEPRPEWGVMGVTGHLVPGHRGMPEFTFVCPNHPEVQQAITRRMETLLQNDIYQGFFLDRVRFPSPAAHPIDQLGCFCEHCRRKADSAGLDLGRVQKAILDLVQTPGGVIHLATWLLGGKTDHLDTEIARCLRDFLDFRTSSVNEFVALLARPLRQANMEIGLDCFSPSLTGMVGQDLGSLSAHVDWIKVMSYAHTLGPAGIPFELLGLFDYLTTATGENPSSILANMSEAIGLPLPEERPALEKDGISASFLEAELRRGVAASSIPVLAGIELVQIEGVANLNATQIANDLAAVRRTGVTGLSISWDLWDIPLERLELVRRHYLVDSFQPVGGS